MKFTSTLLTASAVAVASATAYAADMANEMTIVSWGGAYTKSQINAYHDPYSAKTGVKIINDDSVPRRLPSYVP